MVREETEGAPKLWMNVASKEEKSEKINDEGFWIGEILGIWEMKGGGLWGL